MMVPTLIGKIVLSGSTELRFEIGSYKGKTLLNIRKYVDSARFTGYTKKGIALNRFQARKIFESLRKYSQDFSTDENDEICRIGKNETTNIVTYIVTPDEKNDKAALDVREYVDSESYTGWTQKGFRLSLDRLEEVIGLFENCLNNFDSDLPLFSDDPFIRHQPIKKSDNNDGKVLIKEILQIEIPTFPDDFLPSENVIDKDVCSILKLPPEPIYLGPMRSNKQEIISDAGFEYLAQNPVEAKYICYAHQNNKKQIFIPNKPFITFKIVKKYEVFIRDLQKKLIQLLIRRIKDKSAANILAHKYFKDSKLPWLDEEI